MEGERLCMNTFARVSDGEGTMVGFYGLTDNAPKKDTKTELSFDLGPGYPFGFASEHVPVDILTASSTFRNSSFSRTVVT